ncbi:hypothetical protein [Alteribacter aurantiacus]|uniref:hypothetical protein n=1 Tax=Alteribacter aurantiacus TaxID=254410 RepID=UPI0004220BC0|nr:hypothetical protein [Alteribacter aurantiacus]
MITMPKEIQIHDVEDPPLKYSIKKYNLFFKNELILENVGVLRIAKFIMENTHLRSDDAKLISVLLKQKKTASFIAKALGSDSTKIIPLFNVEHLKDEEVIIENGSTEYINAQKAWQKSYDKASKKMYEKIAASKTKTKETEMIKEFKKAEKLLKKEKQIFAIIESHDTGLDYKNILQYETAEDFRKMQPWYIINENFQIIDLVKCKDDISFWASRKEGLKRAPSRQTIFNYIKEDKKYLGKYYFKKVEDY